MAATAPATENETKSLPANAYLPLKDGEAYVPLVPTTVSVPEVTLRAVLWGTLLCIIFSVASAYSALKVGQGMEAAIPISILAIGLARVYKRRSTVLENMHHHRHRRRFRQRGGRRGLHHSGALHPASRPASGADHLHLPGWRLPGRALSHSAAPLLRAPSSTASCRFPKPRPSPRCWSPARKAVRRPSC